MNKRLVGVCISIIVVVSVAAYALQASAAPSNTQSTPTLQSLNARVGVLETEVKQLRRSEFQNQINAWSADVKLLCSESATPCP